ncbi:MAG TPA: c-type cytochrome [Candidatus Acidoferrales bacterium]|nr:c-type cytochrome [Candidatus Acidoferrales bacterium]
MQDVLQRLNARIHKLLNPTLIASIAVLGLTVGLGAQTEPPKGKTAAEVYKNIQILKDVPANQLVPGMRYITTALGVKCDYCHVKDNFASDDKRPKQTARQMMTMLTAINANNFSGRPEVSCYTCHQGRQEPMGVPALPAEATEPQFIRPTPGAQSQPLPNADAVLDKYAQAIGSEQALNKVASRAVHLDETDSDGKTYAIEAYEKAPGKMYEVTTLPKGQVTAGFDGTRAWVNSDRGTRDAEPEDAIVLRREAAVNPVAALKSYTGRRVRGQAKIGDTVAYVMMGKAPDGIVEFLFFDEQSGLLLRRMIRDTTIFGALPIEADYSDYRDVNGVKIPYKTTWFTAGESSTYTIKDVKDNVPVDDSKFEPPEKQQ